MRIQRFDDVAEFLAVAGDFLTEREAEHNLIFGILASLQETPEAYSALPYLATVHGDPDQVIAAAIQTPPFRLVLSEIDDPAVIPVLAADTLDRTLPGVLGPVGVVGAFAEARAALGGPPSHHHDRERIFRLTSVRSPRPAPGERRLATTRDRDLVLAWIEAFMREAFGTADPAEVQAMTDRWLAERGRTLWLWQDGGETVSLCGIGGATPNGIRIGPVYTPPVARGHGFASNLVAAVSQGALDAGRRFCFLFTDAANLTSNHIYQEIGYEHVRDVDVYRFDQPVTSP